MSAILNPIISRIGIGTLKSEVFPKPTPTPSSGTTLTTSTDIAITRTTPRTIIASTTSTVPTSPASITSPASSATESITSTAFSATESITSTASSTTESITSTVSTASTASTSSSASASSTESTSTTQSTTVTSSTSTSTSSDVESITSTFLDVFTPSTSTHLVVDTSFIVPTTLPSAAATLASNRLSTGAIAGGVGGGVGGLVGLILLMAFCMRRVRKKHRSIANFDPQEFRHTGKEIGDGDSFDYGFIPRPPPRIERHLVPSVIPTFAASGPTYNHGNQYSGGYAENFAGVGSHGAHLPKSRPAPDRVNHGATSSKPIHLMPPLSSVDALAPLPPYTEQHFDQQDLPRLVVQNGGAPANGYGVKSIVSLRHAAPRVGAEVSRGSPISESRSGLPPLPPKPKELQYSGGDLPSQSGGVSPFADPKSEPQTNLKPGHIRNLDSNSGTSQESSSSGAWNTRNFSLPLKLAHSVPSSSVDSSPPKVNVGTTRSMNGSDEDAYDGIL